MEDSTARMIAPLSGILGLVSLVQVLRLWYRRYQLLRTPTTPVEEILEPGRYEVVGKVVSCGPHLSAPLDRSRVVAYSAWVEASYEGTVWDREDQRFESRRRNLSSSRIEDLVPFLVEQDDRVIRVDPEGAELDMEETRREGRPRGRRRGKPGARRGRKGSKGKRGKRGRKAEAGPRPARETEAMPPLPDSPGSNWKCERVESVQQSIRVGQEVYVLGKVVEDEDGLVFRGSSWDGDRFLVSVRSESELLRSEGWGIVGWSLGLLVSSVVCYQYAAFLR